MYDDSALEALLERIAVALERRAGGAAILATTGARR